MLYEVNIRVATGEDSQHGEGFADVAFSTERYGYGNAIRGVLSDDLNDIHAFVLNNVEQAVNLARIKSAREAEKLAREEAAAAEELEGEANN